MAHLIDAQNELEGALPFGEAVFRLANFPIKALFFQHLQRTLSLLQTPEAGATKPVSAIQSAAETGSLFAPDGAASLARTVDMDPRISLSESKPEKSGKAPAWPMSAVANAAATRKGVWVVILYYSSLDAVSRGDLEKIGERGELVT